MSDELDFTLLQYMLIDKDLIINLKLMFLSIVRISPASPTYLNISYPKLLEMVLAQQQVGIIVRSRAWPSVEKC